ncbi:hypothetical protein YC2023_057196 [Brassica napus]
MLRERERESGGPQGGGCHFGQRFLCWEFPKTDKKILYHPTTVASDTRCQKQLKKMKKMKERGQSDPQKLGDFKALTSWPSNPWQFQGTNTIIVAAFTMATALLLLSLCGGVSAATPVLTVHSSDGDVIDCVKKMDQPSLTNPLLKNHSFQSPPSSILPCLFLNWSTRCSHLVSSSTRH